MRQTKATQMNIINLKKSKYLFYIINNYCVIMVEVVIINSSDVYSQILADLESTAKEAQMSNLAFNEWCS